jgi:hypothetical protein
MNINKEELKIWINTLRSGEFQQTTGALQDENGYCCLGVACKVLIPKEKQKFNDLGFLFGGTPDKQPNAPEWLKEINSNYAHFHSKINKCIAELNDHEKFSFAQIADILEKTYLL